MLASVGKYVDRQLLKLRRPREAASLLDGDGGQRFLTSIDTRQASLTTLIRDTLTDCMIEAEVLSGSFRAKVVPVAPTPDAVAQNYIIFLRLDSYVPLLMDRSKAIEVFVIRQMARRFGVTITQIYWRWGDGAQTPYDGQRPVEWANSRLRGDLMQSQA